MAKKTLAPHKRVYPCPTCKGQGTVAKIVRNHTVWVPCSTCGGRGHLVE